MLPQKIFENLHTSTAILVLFQQFLGKVGHIFGLYIQMILVEVIVIRKFM